jgi:manganese/zinc/iron transport system substrate-binding protein
MMSRLRIVFRWHVILIMMISSGFMLTACSGANHNSTATTLKIVTTTGMIADAVRNVGQNLVVVEAFMGPGVDPHIYKATQSDVKSLMNADMVFYHGLHLEGKMIEVLEKLDGERPVVAVTAALDRKTLLKDPKATEYYDPHIWFDVKLWSLVVEQIARELSLADEVNRAIYEKNAQAYKAELSLLDEQVRQQMQSIPEQQRVLITAHDAFSYFGKAYDVQVVALQGISTDAEYSLRDVQKLVNLIAERSIATIFTETSISDRSLRAVLEGAKQRGVEVAFGKPLYSDSLGADDEPAGTYVGMMKANVAAISEGLTRGE